MTELESVSNGVFKYLTRPENQNLLTEGLGIYRQMHQNKYVESIPTMQAWVSKLARHMNADTWLGRNAISSSWRFEGWGNVCWTWYAVVNVALCKINITD